QYLSDYAGNWGMRAGMVNGIYSGLIVPRTNALKPTSVTKGLANMLLIGEKYVTTSPQYPNGGEVSHDEVSAFYTMQTDNCRYCDVAPRQDGPALSSQTNPYDIHMTPFGAAHPAAINAVFGDG